MLFRVVPMSRSFAEAIVTWRYEPPFSFYDLSKESIPDLLNPNLRYAAVIDEDDKLCGFCCFGEEATVEGGHYPQAEPDVFDVGIGMRPHLTGKGLSRPFLKTILRHATALHSPARFRVTIASFNRRSQRAFLTLGFEQTHEFQRPSDGLPFVQLEAEGGANPST